MLNCEVLRAWIGFWLNPNGKCRMMNIVKASDSSRRFVAGQSRNKQAARLNRVIVGKLYGSQALRSP
jgi:hypothetical protein